MEALVSTPWQGRRVLITGHTGFKGSWLSLWLHALGARVTGFALPAPTNPSLFQTAGIGSLIVHQEGDVRDPAAVENAVAIARPDLIFHLAAQPLVGTSYEQPVETYATNVMGTVHLLEAARRVPGVRAVVCVTSDKCYDTLATSGPHSEDDPMGGHDPYSSSKGCAELVTAAYRKSYFMAQGPAVASVRAGNVIGGGDWAADRLVPDLVRAFEAGRAPLIRSPHAVRPWQHVLDALGGYLLLAERLLAGDLHLAGAWNFGPPHDEARSVSWIVEQIRDAWAGTAEPAIDGRRHPYEVGQLRLDCTKARAELGWRPVLPLEEALEWVTAWHKSVRAGDDPQVVTLNQLSEYSARRQSALSPSEFRLRATS